MVWVPSFVLDRTQKVLNVIKKGQQEKKLPKKINIKVVSTTAKKVNKVYDQHYKYRPNSVDESLSMSPTKLSPAISGPMVLLTPSYIDQLDFFHPIVEKIVRSNNSDLMLVGYQDPRSFGGLLKLNIYLLLILYLHINRYIKRFSVDVSLLSLDSICNYKFSCCHFIVVF